MKLYMAEKEAFDDLADAQTLADVVRIGFNRVDFKDKDGKRYECYELIGGNKVSAYASDGGQVEFDGDIMIDQMSVCIDRDEDQYTIVSVEELGD